MGNNVRQIRLALGADILAGMRDSCLSPTVKESLKVKTVQRLAQEMMRYFTRMDMKKELPESWTWLPTEGYFQNQLEGFRAYLRHQKNLFLEYVREQGAWKGEWKFVSKEEYEAIMTREHNGIATLTDNYNERRDDGLKRWPSVALPAIKEMARISYNN